MFSDCGMVNPFLSIVTYLYKSQFSKLYPGVGVAENTISKFMRFSSTDQNNLYIKILKKQDRSQRSEFELKNVSAS